MPAADNEKAGLAIFQNETHFYYLCKSVAKGKAVVQLYQSSGDSMTLLDSGPLASLSGEVYLGIIFVIRNSCKGGEQLPYLER